MLPAAVSGNAASRANSLDFVPGVVVDDRLVCPIMNNAAVHDLADVIRVAQHPMHLRITERAPDILQRLAAAKTPLLKQVSELRDAGLPFGIQAESPADVFGPVGIDHDTLHLAAFDAGNRIEVAEWGDAVRTAALGFLGDPLLRFVREVGRVVLGHARHDGMLELPGRGVVDVLRHRDEHRSGALDGEQNCDVIGTVTGQAVELVHDDIADVVLTDEAQHFLETGPVCGASRGSGVGELMDHFRSELPNSSGTGITLRGDRVPLRFAVLMGLSGRGDTQVRDRARSTCFLRVDTRRIFDAQGICDEFVVHERAPFLPGFEGLFRVRPLCWPSDSTSDEKNGQCTDRSLTGDPPERPDGCPRG